MYLRFVRGLLLTLGVFGCSAALAAAEPGSDVLVTANVFSANGTSADSVTVAALQASPGQCPAYQEPSMNELGRQGFVPVQLAQNDTWSLPSILACLQNPIPVSAVRGITVMDANGSPEEGTNSQLTPADLAASGSDFNNTSEYPVVQALGSLNQYDRPWRGSPQGQTDYDFLDEVQGTQSDQPIPIAIEVFEGQPLTVTANASRTTVSAGGTLSFSATVSGANGSPLSYSWRFDGGAPSSTAAAPQATFVAAGQYDVTVQVTDAAGGGGGADIPVTVGSAPAPASGSHTQKGSGTSRKSHTPTGPKNSNGNHAGSSAGKHTSTTTTSGKTTTTTTSQTSTAPSSSSTTPAHPVAPASATTGTTSSRPPAPHRPRRTAPLTKPPTSASASGPLVTGQLISDVTPLSPGSSPLVHAVAAPQASAPPARQAIRASAVPALASAVVIALLLGLGAARELRGRRGWHARRHGS